MKPSAPFHDSAADEAVESLLRRAAPVVPDEAPMARLRLACPVANVKPGKGRVIPFWLRAMTVAAAAALVLGGWAVWSAGVSHRNESHLTGTAPLAAMPDNEKENVEFYPSLESRQKLISVRDLGVVRDSRERPVRLMSTTWLDENTYGDPGAEPSMRESRLRHEIVPVLLPTY